MNRLRNRLILIFLAATLAPLAATVWITTSLLEQSLGFSSTSELDVLSKSALRTGHELYQRACDGGNAPGCTNLGNMYNNGSGGSQDFVRARSLYQRACDNGNAVGCNNLGYMYEHAMGGPVDLGQAGPGAGNPAQAACRRTH